MTQRALGATGGTQGSHVILALSSGRFHCLIDAQRVPSIVPWRRVGAGPPVVKRLATL